MEEYRPNEMMRPALYFNPEILEFGFDPSVPPANPEEYLQRVIHEAAMCDQIVTAEIDPSKILPQMPLEVLPGLEKVEESMIPSEDWQKCQTLDFAAVRQYITTMKSAGTVKKMRIPGHHDKRSWRIVCIGDTKDSCGNYQTSPPLLSMLINPRMTQQMLLKVLEYNIGWLAEGFSVKQGKWIYALLACVETPLYPETCSLLRELARECSRIRATLISSEHEYLVHLNLLICLVAKYFRQLDLSD